MVLWGTLYFCICVAVYPIMVKSNYMKKMPLWTGPQSLWPFQCKIPWVVWVVWINGTDAVLSPLFYSSPTEIGDNTAGQDGEEARNLAVPMLLASSSHKPQTRGPKIPHPCLMHALTVCWFYAKLETQEISKMCVCTNAGTIITLGFVFVCVTDGYKCASALPLKLPLGHIFRHFVL